MKLSLRSASVMLVPLCLAGVSVIASVLAGVHVNASVLAGVPVSPSALAGVSVGAYVFAGLSVVASVLALYACGPRPWMPLWQACILLLQLRPWNSSPLHACPLHCSCTVIIA